jgi:hypothetical protein
MATFDWPNAWRPKQFDLSFFRATVQSRSPSTQAFHAVDLLAWRWMVSIDMNDELADVAGPHEAFFNRLVGGVNDVRMWHFNRPAPIGTLRGTPTLADPAAQFADLIVVQATPGATLVDGDFLGLPNHLLQVAEPATANGSGLMTVRLVNRLRAAVAQGAAVVWDKPTARFAIPATQSRFGHVGGRMLGSAYDLEEVY